MLVTLLWLILVEIELYRDNMAVMLADGDRRRTTDRIDMN